MNLKCLELLSLHYSSLWFVVGFLTPPPPHPHPRATSMSTPPSNFYMMIRWHSCLLYTLYTHQHLISHFLGCSTFYATPPPKKKRWLENEPLNFSCCPLKNEIQRVSFVVAAIENFSEGTKFCRLLWSRNPNPLFKHLPSLGDCRKKGDIPLEKIIS